MEDLQMRKFTILLSAPSDVAKYMKNISNAVSKFNSECAEEYGVYLCTKNWKDDTYPSYGEEPQAIINRQLVENCDMVIALFGTRKGTPTKNYDSGTIEEITKVHESGKRVLTYFLSGKVALNGIDPEQLAKVNQFKASYNGLYNDFKDARGLEIAVFSALKLIAKEMNKKQLGKLVLKSLNNGELSDGLHYVEYDFISSPLIRNLVSRIGQLIDIIKKNNPPKPLTSDSIKDAPISDENKAKISSILKFQETLSTGSLLKGTPISFSEAFKNTICYYCQENGFELDKETFFFVGGASEFNTIVSYTVNGTEQEKNKVNSIRDLYWSIKKLYGLLSFFREFQGKHFVSLVISNTGNSFCEDIDLVIKFASGYMFDVNSISFTEEQSAKVLQEFVKEILDPNEDTEIGSMNYGREIVRPFVSSPGLLGGSNEPDLDYYNDVFHCEIRNLYPFTKDVKNGTCSLKIHIGDLKQFTSAHVCGALVFDKPIDKLDYIITTKSLNRQEKGTLLLKKGDEND